MLINRVLAVSYTHLSKNKKKNRSYFPSSVSEFVKGSCQNKKKIYVLLVNMQLLTSNSCLLYTSIGYSYYQVITNILLFMPLGFLLPLLFEDIRSLKKVFAVSYTHLITFMD